MYSCYSLFTRFFFVSGLLVLSACSNTGSSNQAPGGGLPATYRSPDDSFSVRHPDGWGTEENHHLITKTYEADGTAIMAPTDRKTSTLYEGVFHIANIPQCPELDGTDDVVINDRTYHHAEWNDEAAGNRYEGETFASETDKGCLVVTFYAHGCNLSPEECGPTSPEPYDKETLFAIMRQMLETLKISL